MTAEEALRRLAEHQRRMVMAATPKYQQELILSARQFLTGAMMALIDVGVLDHPAPEQLLEELLAPLEQPLVDAGVLDRAKISAEVREVRNLLLSLRDEHEQ